MLTVHKIGGSSMSKFEDVLQNIVLGQAAEGFYYNRIFVVSAYNNVTNWLLEHKKTGEPGVYDLFVKNRDYRQALEVLLQKLLDINHELKGIKLDLQLKFRFGSGEEVLASPVCCSGGDLLPMMDGLFG